jgi:hypothetical protein
LTWIKLRRLLACATARTKAPVRWTAGAGVEFFVVPMSTSHADTWLVCMDSLSHCVGVHASADNAVANAIIKAQYQVACGNEARVQLMRRDLRRWQVIWPPAAPSGATPG